MTNVGAFKAACKRASYPLNNRCEDVAGIQDIIAMASSMAVIGSPPEVAMTVPDTVTGTVYSIVVPVTVWNEWIEGRPGTLGSPSL